MVSDAMFLASGELLVVGSHGTAWDIYPSHPWAAKVNAHTAEVLWSYVLEDSNAYRFCSVTSFGEGFLLCTDDYNESDLMLVDEAGKVGPFAHVNFRVLSFLTDINGIVVAGTNKQGGACGAMLDSEGNVVWRYDDASFGETPGYFSSVVSIEEGYLFAGGIPDHQQGRGGAYLVRLDSKAKVLWCKWPNELGLITDISGMVFEDGHIALAGNTNDYDGALTVLNENGDFLLQNVIEATDMGGTGTTVYGVYPHKSGKGYTLYGFMGGEPEDDIWVERYPLVYLMDRQSNFLNEYHPPYGREAEIMKVLRDANDTVWVVGQGNWEGDVFRREDTGSNDKKVFIGYVNPILLDMD